MAAPSRLQRPSGDRVKTDLLTELPDRMLVGRCGRRVGLARFLAVINDEDVPRELSGLVVPLARVA